MFCNFNLPFPPRVLIKEFTAPNILVRPIVISFGHIHRDVLNKLTYKIRGAPTEIIHVIVAEGPQGFELFGFLDLTDKFMMMYLPCRTVNVSLGVFEAEDKMMFCFRSGAELLYYVLGAGFMLAMYKGNFSIGLNFSNINHT